MLMFPGNGGKNSICNHSSTHVDPTHVEIRLRHKFITSEEIFEQSATNLIFKYIINLSESEQNIENLLTGHVK